MLENLQAGRRQATVIAITPDRLVVETSGPFGMGGYAWAREQIVAISTGCDILRDERGRRRKLERLEIQIAGRKRVAVAPARDRAELRWVARAIGRAMSVSVDV